MLGKGNVVWHKFENITGWVRVVVGRMPTSYIRTVLFERAAAMAEPSTFRAKSNTYSLASGGTSMPKGKWGVVLGLDLVD